MENALENGKLGTPGLGIQHLNHEPPSGFELVAPGLGIQHLNH